MENPQINTGDVNPLNPNTTGSGDGSSSSDYQHSAAQTGGTGSNRSLPTDGPLRQNLDEEPDLTDNDNVTDDEEFEDELDTEGDDLETGDDEPDVISSGNLPGDDQEDDSDLELFDDDLELDGDTDDLNSDIDDDDLDTLDGPLLDENNPHH